MKGGLVSTKLSKMRRHSPGDPKPTPMKGGLVSTKLSKMRRHLVQGNHKSTPMKGRQSTMRMHLTKGRHTLQTKGGPVYTKTFDQGWWGGKKGGVISDKLINKNPVLILNIYTNK